MSKTSVDFERAEMLLSVAEKAAAHGAALSALMSVAGKELKEMNEEAQKEIDAAAKAEAEAKAKADAEEAKKAETEAKKNETNGPKAVPASAFSKGAT